MASSQASDSSQKSQKKKKKPEKPARVGEDGLTPKTALIQGEGSRKEKVKMPQGSPTPLGYLSCWGVLVFAWQPQTLDCFLKF
jgi:hypothetical protein